MKDFIKEVQKNPVLAGMAFSFLMDKGATVLSAISADEFSAALDVQIKDAEEKGTLFMFSKEDSPFQDTFMVAHLFEPVQ